MKDSVNSFQTQRMGKQYPGEIQEVNPKKMSGHRLKKVQEQQELEPERDENSRKNPEYPLAQAGITAMPVLQTGNEFAKDWRQSACARLAAQHLAI